eukprot:9479130-Lingulodinium_polyedra.AAC.1
MPPLLESSGSGGPEALEPLAGVDRPLGAPRGGVVGRLEEEGRPRCVLALPSPAVEGAGELAPL